MREDAPVTIRVLLADDHRLVREALRDALSRHPEIQIAGEAGSGLDALEQAHRLEPDVVVLDIGLPDLNGIEVATRLRRHARPPQIVALSGYADKRFVTEMLHAGATAYVAKSAAGTELVRAIHAAAAGQSYFCPEVAGALAAEVRGRGERRLGRREREVLRLIAEGLRSPAIAEQLHVSVATVEAHRRNIMRKLDLHTVADLTKHAIREGIVSL
jgi:two-component system NarL family response regulator